MEQKKEEMTSAFQAIEQEKLPPIDSSLNQKQTFQNFLEGTSNKLARTIGLYITDDIESPQFNPLFIYGQTGCGKTHLANAIGNHCKEKYPDKRVLYVNAKTFQLQFVNATKQGNRNDFIAFYQTLDMLLVDDVQEWLTAPNTQVAFFHIFNYLFKNGKRIILVSDRTPAELEGMSDRLLGRFTCGLVAEMLKPDKQLLTDILKEKAKQEGITMPQDVVDYIADSVVDNIYKLEGVINGLKASQIAYNCDIDLELVKNILTEKIENPIRLH